MAGSIAPIAAAPRAAAAPKWATVALSADQAKARAAALLRPEEPQAKRRAAEGEALTRALAQSRQDAKDARKTQAGETVRRLYEQFKLIKKLYSANPQELARQLAKIFKELKTALKDYAAAVKAAPPSPAAADAAAVTQDAQAALNAAAAQTGEDAPDPQGAHAAAREAAEAYRKAAALEDDLARGARSEEAQGALAFLHEVRGYLKSMLEAYAEAKIKAAFQAKARDEPFKQADAALKELEETMGDMEADARAALDAAPRQVERAV